MGGNLNGLFQVLVYAYAPAALNPNPKRRMFVYRRKIYALCLRKSRVCTCLYCISFALSLPYVSCTRLMRGEAKSVGVVVVVVTKSNDFEVVSWLYVEDTDEHVSIFMFSV